MRNIKEWMTIAENASRIVTKDPGNLTAEDIRQQAAEQLILAGYPYDTDRNGHPVVETGEYRFVVQMIARPGSEESAKIVKDLLSMEKEQEYVHRKPKKEPPASPAEDTVPATEPLRRPDKKTEPAVTTDTDGIKPISFDEPEPKAEEKPKKAETFGAEETRPLYVAAKSPQTGGKGYTDHMAKSDILFNYHNCRIRSADGIEMNVEIIVSPMSAKDGEKQIFVWGSDGIKTEVSGPSGTMPTRLVRFGEVDLIVEGHMENGQFVSSVNPTKRMLDRGVTLTSQDEHMGGSGHLMLEDKGIEIRLVPTTTRNKRDGSAEFYYMIKQDGKEAEFGDNTTKDSITFEYDGKMMELIARWSNDVLYSTVREI